MLVRHLLISLLSLSFLLSACAPSGQGATPTTLQGTLTRSSTGVAPVAGTRVPGCTVVSRQPTPNSAEQSLLPPPNEKDWVKGLDDAYVTIIEYSDFQ